jgi:quinol monooxygenase YgiN
LNAKNQSNACECLDYLQVQVLSEANAGGTSDALLQYAWPGGAFQPASSGTVASSVAVPFQLRLKANPSGFTSPTFKWQTNRSDGTFSPSDTAREPTLLVAGQPGESAISLSVTLTVTEAGDPSVTEQATANFQLIVTGASAAPGNADFAMSEESAEPGTLVTMEGYADSASGLGAADLDYFWTVVTGDGDPVDVLTSHNRAIFEVPTASETSSALSVTMTAAENGVPSAPVVKGLNISSPTLRFAHFGAGPTGGQILEVQLILVNDSDEAVEEGGRLWFVKQDGTPNSVMVDDELVEEGVLPFSVGPESSRMFKIVTPDEDLRVGWMAVSSPVPLEGVVLFQYVDADSGRIQTETALFASETGRRVSIAVNGRAGAIGFAIANPSVEAAVDCIVGIPVDGAALEVPVTLQPLEQKALFLNQFHELVGANMKVSGTLFLEVQGNEGGVVTTVLRLTNAGLSTLPVAVRKE